MTSISETHPLIPVDPADRAVDAGVGSYSDFYDEAERTQANTELLQGFAGQVAARTPQSLHSVELADGSPARFAARTQAQAIHTEIYGTSSEQPRHATAADVAANNAGKASLLPFIEPTRS